MRELKITKQITNCEADSLKKYFKEISRIKLITLKEEQCLLQKIKTGDEKAMDELIMANLRFVVSVAKQYQNRGLPLTDLINEGNIGLMKAVKRFDEQKGFKLISYAVWWIRQCIMQALDDKSRVVRVPANQVVLYSKLQKVFIKMEQEFEREPSYSEVSEEICLSEKAIEDILKTSKKQVSIDAPIGGTDEFTLADVLPCINEEKAEQLFSNESLKKDLSLAVSVLKPIEISVLLFSYGLESNPQMTIEEISDKLGVDKNKVRQIRYKALINLKQVSGKFLKEYMG